MQVQPLTYRKETVDGYEMTMALNHLSYFLLTNKLLDLLKRTAEKTGDVRIVNVSSGAHTGARKGINFDDFHSRESYSGFGKYSESKLANILFTYELARQLEGANVTTTVLHPGFVATGFGHNNSGLFGLIIKGAQRFLAMSPEKGAETMIYLATSPEVKGITGKYFEKKSESQSSNISHDEAMQKRLWELSEELTGIGQANIA